MKKDAIKINKITKNHLRTLTLIGVLTSLFVISLIYLINNQKNHSNLINISGKQRMLSQRGTMFVNEYLNTEDSKERKEVGNLIEVSFDEFERAHNLLSTSYKDEKEFYNQSKEIKALYFNGNNSVDKLSKTYINLGRNFQNSTSFEERLKWKKEINQLSKFALLKRLNDVVLQFEQEGKSQFTIILITQSIITILILIFLFIEYRFIFTPIKNRFKKNLIKLEAEKKSALSANKAKDRFLQNMSHELKTPLNGIIGSTDLLIKEKHLNEQKELLHTLKSSGDMLRFIINDILDITKLEKGNFSLKKTHFNIKDLLLSCSNIVKLPLKQSGNTLSVKIQKDFPSLIETDKERLEQVLLNLLSNAIKFSSDSKITIEISSFSKEDKTFTSIKVIDQGKGIEKDKLEGIFQQFFQADDQRDNKTAGTGLGLAICKSIIEKLGGEIKVESEVGIGTTFSFYIRSNFSEASATEQEVVELSDINVLVAEDNKINQSLIKKFLQKLGVEYELASNGREAVNFVKEKNFDVILMDIQMPELDGVEATKIIRALGNNTPIYAITANTFQDDIKEYYNIGMNDVLPKPITLEKLREKLSLIRRT